MPKIRKLKRRKKFRANVNRKRLRNKLYKLPNIECQQIKDAWEAKRSTVKNLEEMGLAYDPNKVLKVPNMKEEMLKFVNEEGEESESEPVEEKIPSKLHVVQSLEAEAKTPRARLFKLPNNEVMFATYMMDKYGDDYKAMVRDRKNYNQLTWKQIKAKIERFKSVPEQYAEYLVKKGEIVLEDPTPLKKIKPQVESVKPAPAKPSAKPSKRKRKNKASLLQSVWQEESVGENDSIMEVEKSVGDNDENKPANNAENGEKKLQLFSDEEDVEDDEDDDDDEEEEEDDDSEDDLDEEDSDNASVKNVKLSKTKPQKKARKV